MTLLSDEADRLRALAAAHQRAAADASRAAKRFEEGDAGEQRVQAMLQPLERQGWHALHARQWPGTRRADLDHVLVGPAGVVVLDTKTWRGDVRVGGGRLWQGQDDRSSDVEDLLAQVGAVEGLLTPLGLAPSGITGALVLVGQRVGLVQLGRAHVVGEDHLLRWLAARGHRLDADQVQQLTGVLQEALPPLEPLRRVVPVVRSRPRPRTVDREQEELFPAAELDLAEVERAARLPLESWMTFLHPAQLDVVRRRYNGPSRVRGPAGCGKTVVALHRAAYLAAQEPGDLLFLSYVRTLPQVLAQVFARLAPHHVERVRFRSVHSTALDVLARAGVTTRLDVARADTCFNLAWARVGRTHLERPDLPLRYWREEVRSVIKGRGLQEMEEYAGLARTGRRTPLLAEQRRRVWDLYVAYQDLLDDRRVQDLEDVVGLALDTALRDPDPPYRFVLVDEAQDLDLQCVRLAASLATASADGLTLVGDGQQSLYAGGYTLKEAGLTVTGRSTVLTVNYRNTREVLAAAQDVVRGDDFDDLEDLAESGDRAVEAVRSGA